MEAVAIVLVAAVTAVIFVTTWIGAQQNGGRHALGTREQLEAYRETLRAKAQRAQVERWDEAMVARLDHELADVEQRLARIEQQRA
jgi:hypothetical protein